MIQSTAETCKRVCIVCTTAMAKYTCPRCNIPYCSIKCYKKHDIGCTESFYKKNVEEELAYMNSSGDHKVSLEQAKMKEILERISNQDDFDESIMNENDITDTLGEVDEDHLLNLLAEDKLSISNLSPNELKHFERAIRAGQLSHSISVWKPWWHDSETVHHEHFKRQCRLKPVILEETNHADTEDDNDNDSSTPSDLTTLQEDEHDVFDPEIFKKVINPVISLRCYIKTKVFDSMHSLLPSTNQSRQPSPLLKFNLLDVLFSYAFTLRMYNGDIHCEDSINIIATLLKHSELLSSKCVRESTSDAIQALTRNLVHHEPSLRRHPEAILIYVQDVVAILSSHHYLMDCMHDLMFMFQSALNDSVKYINSIAADASIDKECRKHTLKRNKKTIKKLNQYIKKLHFYTIYSNEMNSEILDRLRLDVENEILLIVDREKESRIHQRKSNDTPSSVALDIIKT